MTVLLKLPPVDMRVNAGTTLSRGGSRASAPEFRRRDTSQRCGLGIERGAVGHLDRAAGPGRVIVRVLLQTTRMLVGVAAVANVPSHEMASSR
jgi:hypothetical protein